MKLTSLSILLLSIVTTFVISSYKYVHQRPWQLPRIAIAGIAIESSTFSPARTDEAAFHAKYGPAGFTSYPFLSADSALRNRAIWIPTVIARALPGGVVTRQAYESLVNKTIDSLKKHLPYDGVYLDIHGAMSVEGLDDPEGDYLERIRKAVGNTTLISTSMDLHGNVSYRLAQNTDLITCYRKAPHEDALETKKRAITQLLNRIETGKGKPPYKAYVRIPVLLPGEKTSTRQEPAKSVYAAVTPAANQPGIVDASLWVGYAWADEPRNHAAAMAVGDDKYATIQTAEKLARTFWNARSGYHFVAPAGSLAVCLSTALSSSKRPFFISDCGDNPTAGAAGDVTWTLKALLARPEFAREDGPSLIYAAIPGAEFAEKALAAGVGAHVEGYVGALVDHRFAGPVLLSGKIIAVVKGDEQAEIEVVVQVGALKVIVTKIRKSYRTEADFKRLGLDMYKADIVVVKLGYLDPDLYKAQAGWMLALTPGGADQDLEHLKFKRIQRPMFPFDKAMATPDLSAKLIPLSGK
ncbi:M81 family metallopeptidase [Mucilaginibacter psychrotolerans]|uniref:M81 family peptidase n=1 Tax=Mucilaginibacter psychrotolerans TaxID=1524096 RepID=A0A4Y8SLC8_9SPHI|nr:M81 family metallopeptidase [Mucilaginibacter psychrotolerans]TFF39317.1 M81 family peptidase [Mucilaginibacter psychrotolerans]